MILTCDFGIFRGQWYRLRLELVQVSTISRVGIVAPPESRSCIVSNRRISRYCSFSHVSPRLIWLEFNLLIWLEFSLLDMKNGVNIN